MISRLAIEERVREWGLREDVVEKDYVIGWVLWGIGSDATLGAKWAFKGGTCLKKCYIETYRFSEDLDFTVLPGGPIRPEDVQPLLLATLARVTEEAGIDFSQRAPMLRGHESGNYTEGRIYYRGPRMAPMVASLKLDLSISEQVARPTVEQSITHVYPDELPPPALIRCYAFEELFAEKIRAMSERGRPRDLYDIVNLFRRSDLQDQAKVVRDTLEEKCRSKGVPFPTLGAMQSSSTRAELESEWSNMLAHQLPMLPPLAEFWNELPGLFRWLLGEEVRPGLPVVSAPGAEPVEAGWAPSPTISTWNAAVPLESIRFAAANLLCVELGYGGTKRIVEPYSLRRSQAGHLLLYAVRSDNREPRAYRIDRIQSVRVTDQAFRPTYRVELSAGGVLRAPSLARASHVPRRPQRTTSLSHGPTYVIKCGFCQKTFRRKKAGDTRLNDHKAAGGWRCPGSGGQGFLIETRYQ